MAKRKTRGKPRKVKYVYSAEGTCESCRKFFRVETTRTGQVRKMLKEILEACDHQKPYTR